MTQATHTTGPWHITTSSAAHAVRNRHGERICSINTAVTDQLVKARLIAAAPELLAALLPLVNASPVNGGMIRFDGEELAAARAAIAKAKGE